MAGNVLPGTRLDMASRPRTLGGWSPDGFEPGRLTAGAGMPEDERPHTDPPGGILPTQECKCGGDLLPVRRHRTPGRLQLLPEVREAAPRGRVAGGPGADEVGVQGS